jgi:hypothetical protein
VEGAVLLRKTGDGSFSASFAPNFGGGALEAKPIADREALLLFLKDIGITDESRRVALLQLEQEGVASLPQVLLSPNRLSEFWPVQFGVNGVPT